jgi:hypothetical protein
VLQGTRRTYWTQDNDGSCGQDDANIFIGKIWHASSQSRRSRDILPQGLYKAKDEPIFGAKFGSRRNLDLKVPRRTAHDIQADDTDRGQDDAKISIEENGQYNMQSQTDIVFMPHGGSLDQSWRICSSKPAKIRAVKPQAHALTAFNYLLTHAPEASACVLYSQQDRNLHTDGTDSTGEFRRWQAGDLKNQTNLEYQGPTTMGINLFTAYYIGWQDYAQNFQGKISYTCWRTQTAHYGRITVLDRQIWSTKFGMTRTSERQGSMEIQFKISTHALEASACALPSLHYTYVPTHWMDRASELRHGHSGAVQATYDYQTNAGEGIADMLMPGTIHCIIASWIFSVAAMISARLTWRSTRKGKKKHQKITFAKRRTTRCIASARLIAKRRYKWPRTNGRGGSRRCRRNARKYHITFREPQFLRYTCTWRPGLDRMREGPIWINLASAIGTGNGDKKRPTYAQQEEKNQRNIRLDGERLHPHPGMPSTSLVINLEEGPCVDLITQGDPADEKWSEPGINNEFIIELTNPTNAFNRMLLLDDRNADVTVMVEHSILPTNLQKFYAHFKSAKRKCLLYPVDKASAKTNLGGVGVIYRNRRGVKITPNTKDFRDAIDSGRVGLVAIDAGAKQTILMAILYGQSGGSADSKKAQYTNRLARICRAELDTHPKGPKLLMGDFNADLKDISVLQCMIDFEGWTDLGHEAARWGGEPDEFTCLAYNSNKPTRRDYILANLEALRMIRGFRVLQAEPFPVHSVVQIRVTAGEPDHPPLGKKEPSSLYEALRTYCRAKMGCAAKQPDVTTPKTQEEEERGMPSRPLPEDQADDDMQDEAQIGDEGVPGRAEAGLKVGDDDIGNLKQLTPDEQEIATKEWNNCLEILYNHMDTKFEKKRCVLKSLLDKQDTTRWMLEWSRIIEDSVIEVTKQLPGVAKVMRGRGGTTVTSHKKPTDSNINAANHTTRRCKPTEEIRKNLIQARRCQAWADRLRLMTKSKLSDHQRTLFQTLNVQAAEEMVEELDPADPDEANLLKIINDYKTYTHALEASASGFSCHRIKIQLASMQSTLAKRLKVLQCNQEKGERDKGRQQYQGDKYLRKAYKDIRSNATAPLNHTTRATTTTSGEKRIDYITDPTLVDQEVRRRWDEVYKGNVDDPVAHPNKFCETYSEHLHKAAESLVGDIIGNDLWKLCRFGNHNAGSLDGWTPADLSVISPTAAEHLAEMLNKVEAGAPWPKHLPTAKAVFLAKDPHELDDPMGFRVLTILPTIYRKWASLRLASMDDWVKTWNNDDIYTVGAGADEAWWITALAIEEKLLKGELVIGGAADLKKAFDQIQRPLLYKLQELGGMPSRIRGPYQRYLETLQVHNVVAEGIGHPYHRPTSIPQGDPLSMLMMAFLLLPWAKLMRSKSACPRVLADDVMIRTEGPNAELEFVDRFEETLRYMVDMGAEVSKSKSFIFASQASVRKRMREKVWRTIGGKLPATTHARDLGTHLNVGATMIGGTMTNRIKIGAKIANRVAWMPLSKNQKLKLIRTAVLPKALYGCEAAPCSDGVLGKLQTAIGRVAGGWSRKRSNAMTFAAQKEGDPDPDNQILCRRIMALRRMTARHPEQVSQVRSVWEHYKAQDFCGIFRGESALQKLAPAPPPGAKGRKHWKPKGGAKGPIGLLLISLHMAAACLDEEMKICQHLEEPVDVYGCPWQHLKPEVMDIGGRARHRFAASQRRALHGVQELDTHLLQQCSKEWTKEEVDSVNATSNLSTWDDTQLADIDFKDDNTCFLCGEADGSMAHLIGRCQKLNHIRVDKELAACCHLFPDPILLGIPPALSAEGQGAWWDSFNEDRGTPSRPLLLEQEDQEHQRRERAHQLRGNSAANKLFGKVHPATQAFFRLKERTPREKQMNARQLVRHLRGTYPLINWKMPHPCTDRPPEKVNVYSDGSLKNPHCQMWALGGLGVWWPGRRVEEMPLSWAEKEFAHQCIGPAWLDHQPQDGMMLIGALTGQRCSSTRTELAAGILAIHAPGAVNQGTDSMAYTVRARNILDGADLTRRKPWSIQKDGDLWEIFEASANAKGRDSITITKVKAHATAEMINNGITTQDHKSGNDKADCAADISIALHGKEVTEIAHYYSKRHREYGAFMLRMRTMMLAIRKEVQRIRKDNDDLKKVRIAAGIDLDYGQEVATQLSYPDHSETRRIQMIPIRPDPEQDSLEVEQLSAKMVQRRMELHIWGFVAYNTWGIPATGHQGVTWIELFTRYVMTGGIYQTTQSNDPTTRIKRVTPKQGLERFTKTFKRITQTCLLPQDRYLFRPAKAGVRRLKDLAFSSHMGATCTIPGWRHSVARLVADHILLASKGWTREDTEKRDSGGLIRQLGRYTMARIPGEKYTGGDKDWCERLRRIICTIPDTRATVANGDTGHNMAIYCPSCRCPRVAQGKITLLNGSQFRIVVCPACKGAKQSSQWLCECGIPWHICATHLEPGHACRAKPRCPRGQLGKRTARQARMQHHACTVNPSTYAHAREASASSTIGHLDNCMPTMVGSGGNTRHSGTDHNLGTTGMDRQMVTAFPTSKQPPNGSQDAQRLRPQGKPGTAGGALAASTPDAEPPHRREKLARKAERALRRAAKRRRKGAECVLSSSDDDLPRAPPFATDNPDTDMDPPVPAIDNRKDKEKDPQRR